MGKGVWESHRGSGEKVFLAKIIGTTSLQRVLLKMKWLIYAGGAMYVWKVSRDCGSAPLRLKSAVRGRLGGLNLRRP